MATCLRCVGLQMECFGSRGSLDSVLGRDLSWTCFFIPCVHILTWVLAKLLLLYIALWWTDITSTERRNTQRCVHICFFLNSIVVEELSYDASHSKVLFAILHDSLTWFPVADGGARYSPTCILGIKKEKQITDKRKAGRASKTKLPPPPLISRSRSTTDLLRC